MRVAATALVLLLAGCGAAAPREEPAAEGVPASAGRALECDGPAYRSGSGDYDDGLATVQDYPETALVDYLAQALSSDELPRDGYRVERRGDGRALLSYDVEGRTKVAVIAADGTRDFNGSRGWGVETWAQCDPAELPASFTEGTGTGVWEDGRGNRVPVSRVRSFRGSAHCGWQDVTYLAVRAAGRERWFLRDTTGGELGRFLRTTFDPAASLPRDATRTGLRREGRVLWVTADAAYLVRLDDPRDVERWPATKGPEPPLCS